MNKKFIAPILGSSFLMMGLSMPSCPGQQALQQQVDALKTSETDMKNRLSATEASVKAMKEDLDQSKALVAQLSKTVVDQTSTLEKLDEAVKALSTKSKPAASKAAPAKAGAKRK